MPTAYCKHIGWLMMMAAMWSAVSPVANAASAIKLIAFGDSLTAGYLLPADQAFPAVLQRELKQRGHNVEITNAGVSGDTTATALDRMDWAGIAEADAVVVELGANDALRGLAASAARENLDKIIGKLAAANKPILIAGMRAPSNLGESYQKEFDSIFPDLAAKHNALLYPFFLEAIALKPEFNLSDGIHPNKRGVELIVASILPKVEALLDRVKAQRAAGATKAVELPSK